LLLKRKILLPAIAGIVLVYGVVMVLQSRLPGLPPLRAAAQPLPGVVFVSMLGDLMERQLDGFGGWLPNDLPLSPGYFLDNLPNFQLGVLQVLRHDTRVLRDNLSRQRTSDAIHREADQAFTAFANDPTRWAFPSAEGAYQRGVDALVRFRRDLNVGAHFYPRADNLVQLLEVLVSELGATTTRLLLASQSDQVSWYLVDDAFYYAQGVGYALTGTMKAVRVDFAPVLEDKRAMEIMDQVIGSLEASQFDPWIVTNGGKAGILANHASNVKVYLDDARQKMGSLISILKQG